MTLSRERHPPVPPVGDDFVSRVLDVVGSIPPGQVLSYGEVAAFLGSRGARTVGQVMARYGNDVPWWRVIRSSGQPPIGHEARARPHYESESTPLIAGRGESYRIDIAAARWRP